MEHTTIIPVDSFNEKTEPDLEDTQVNLESNLEEQRVNLTTDQHLPDNLFKIEDFPVKFEIIENLQEEKPNVTDLLVANVQEEKCVLKSETIVAPDLKNDIKDVKILLVDIKYCGYGDLFKLQCGQDDMEKEVLNNDLINVSSTSDLQDFPEESDHDEVDSNNHNTTCIATNEIRNTSSSTPCAAKKKYFKPLKFICTYCDKRFPQSDILRRHIRIHTGEKPHSCHICKKHFRTKTLRNLHVRIHFYKLKPHVCTVCNKRFNQKGSLESHILIHHQDRANPFSCDKCKMSFSHKSSLKNHIVKLHLKISSKEEPCICFYCKGSYKSREILLGHIRHVHLKISSEEEPCICFHCKGSYKSRKLLLGHIRHVHLNRKYITCRICSKAILTRSVKSHMKIHNNDKPFECALCNIRFSFKASLQSHLSQTHSEERLYKCSKCEKSFKSDTNLKAHIEVHHDEIKEKKCICNYCNQSFYRLVYLKRHMKIHSEDNKKIKCDVCGYSCIRKLDMERHMYTHFGGAPKPFKCDECNTSFIKNSHLLRHKQSKHTDLRPYSCDQCDKSYKDPGSLKTHKNFHLKKLFTCEKCDFKSVNEHSFKRHLRRTFCKKPPRDCPYCEKQMTSEKFLENHLKNKHPNCLKIKSTEKKS